MRLKAPHFAGKTWKGLTFDRDGVYSGEVPNNLKAIMGGFGIKEEAEPVKPAEPKPTDAKKEVQKEVKNG